MSLRRPRCLLCLIPRHAALIPPYPPSILTFAADFTPRLHADTVQRSKSFVSRRHPEAFTPLPRPPEQAARCGHIYSVPSRTH